MPARKATLSWAEWDAEQATLKQRIRQALKQHGPLSPIQLVGYCGKYISNQLALHAYRGTGKKLKDLSAAIREGNELVVAKMLADMARTKEVRRKNIWELVT